MISVTLEYTDNLGPEADIPALLAKLAALLGQRFEVTSDDGVSVSAVRLTEFAYLDAEHRHWAGVTARVRLPAAKAEGLRAQIFEDFTNVIEGHLDELFTRRSISLLVVLEPVAAGDAVRRIHLKPEGGDSF